MLRLIISESSGERTFATERNEILLGRRDGVDLALPDPETALNHCLLRVEGDGVALIDLGSQSGTFVDGRRVAQAKLEPGQEFTVGGTRIRVAAFSAPVVAAVAAATRAAPAAAPAATPRPLQLEAPAKPAAKVPVAPVARQLGPGDEFAREVRAMLKRSPWYFTSLLVHVLALMILDLIVATPPAVGRKAHMAAIDNAELPAPEDLDADTDPELEDIKPEIDPLEELDDLDEPLSKAVRKDPTDSDFDSEEDALEDLGTGKGGVFKLRRALPVKTTIKGATDRINRGDLTGEQGRARDAVARDLGDGLARAKKRLSPRNILVVRGDFDKIENVLDAYEWPYTPVTREQLLRRKFPGAKLLFVNCARRPLAAQRKKLVAITKSFVQSGGWLITSDWAVDPYLTLGFPDRVKVIKPTKRQADTTVRVQANTTSPLLAGVFGHQANSSWWIEETSTMVAVTPGRANILVKSPDMHQRYGAETVVFEFRHRGGRVLHLLGHFYQKDGNRMGLVGMHRLINNIIIARVMNR